MAVKNKLAVTIFIVVYAIVTTGLSYLIKQYPTIRSMENATYDQLQRWWTVDSRKDYRYDELQLELNEFRLINLDTNFFDHEKERVKRGELAKLLDVLAKRPEVEVVFLDFLFVPAPGSQKEDSLLLNSMKILGDRLVLPFNVPSGILKEDSITPHKRNKRLLYPSATSGYLDYRTYLDDENVHRKAQIGNEQDTVPSALYALIKALRKKKTFQDLREAPEVIEINFIFRNELALHPKTGRPLNSRAVRWIDASAVLNNANLAESEKIVFIGLFDTLLGKHDLPIDKFTTPVSSDMSGVYLIINSYLNIITQSFLRPSPWSLTFLVNLMLALVSVFYYKKMTSVSRKWWWEGGELILGGLFFILLLNGLYLFYHTKFPFVVTTVFFIANQHLYQKYRQHTPKFLKS